MTAKSFPPETPEATEFVGAHLPRPLAAYLRLLAVYKGKSIQKTLEALVSEERDDGWDEILLADELALKAIEEWKERGTPDLKKYLNEIKGVLDKKKIADHHRDLILERIRENAPWGDSA